MVEVNGSASEEEDKTDKKDKTPIGHFINFSNGKAIDVSGGKDEEARPVIVWKKHNGTNQKWGIVYLDTKAKQRTKGLNEEYGFYINRPFYMKSRMLFGRVAAVYGASNIRLERYRKNVTDQQFWFDEATKTVKS